MPSKYQISLQRDTMANLWPYHTYDGSTGYGHFEYDYEPHAAIDRMIDACNLECMDCGEGADDCDCPNFIYDGKRGEFSGNVGPNFDFDDVMSNISGTREWSK